MEEEKYHIAVGVDMIQVLEVFVQRGEPLGITQLANELKMSKNKVFRIIQTYKAFGYIQKTEFSDFYELGPKVFEMAALVRQQELP